MSKYFVVLKLSFLLLLIQGCGNNGFHLRENVELKPQYTKIYLQGITGKTDFTNTFTEVLAEAGGKLVNTKEQAKSSISFSKFEDGRRVIAYTSERKAREYLVFLKIEYTINQQNKKSIQPKWRINIDRSYLYDPDFALGKAEEEKRVKQVLYEEATRLILLRLEYSKQS